MFNAAHFLVDRQLERGFGDRTAVLSPETTWTYGELDREVRRTTAGLRAAGLRPEERVLLFAADSPALLASILAVMRVGAVPVPVSTMYKDAELAELLSDCRARFLVVSGEFATTAEKAVPMAPDLAGVVVLDDTPFKADLPVLRWTELAGDDDRVYPTSPDAPALWLYTSGTTGRPKAAMHRHANIRHVVETYADQVLGVGPDDRCLSVAKLFFAYGIGNSCFFPLAAGGTAVLDPARPSPQGVAQRVREARPTLFFAGPTFFAALLNASDIPDDSFRSVRYAVSAGESLPAALFERFRERFGVEILDGIGSTEALHIFLSNRPGAVRPGTTGVPVPGYELRIAAGDGGEAGPGVPGLLFLRGPSLATGYWCRTDTSRSVFQGEWLATGDIYVRGDDGYFTCLGRDNDILKAGGIWVSPAEVEARLLLHPSVAQVAVVAVTDGDGLEKPVACVVAAAGHGVDPEVLTAFCREGLASFKRPRHVLAFEVLPTTATGKLQRYVLRTLAAEALKSGLG